ncbi:IS1380 family transposase, partial [Arthrobacter sp. UYCo732]
MQVSHRPAVLSVSFDEPNLVASAGLLPVMVLARDAGLHELADEWLSLPTDKGANAGLKVASLVAGMVAGADSIDDMAVLRRGGMKRLFKACYAPSTLGSFLRSFTFGHVRQLDAVASRFLGNLAGQAPLLGSPTAADFVFVDVDDTTIEVHGYAKQGSGYGYSGVRGLNALLATASAKDTAPVILAQRRRKGAANSARGAKRLITDALSTLKRLNTGGRVLRRFDSAFYGHAAVSAALAGAAEVSVTVRMDPAVKRAIAGIPETAWKT